MVLLMQGYLSSFCWLAVLSGLALGLYGVISLSRTLMRRGSIKLRSNLKPGSSLNQASAFPSGSIAMPQNLKTATVIRTLIPMSIVLALAGYAAGSHLRGNRDAAQTKAKHEYDMAAQIKYEADRKAWLERAEKWKKSYAEWEAQNQQEMKHVRPGKNSAPAPGAKSSDSTANHRNNQSLTIGRPRYSAISAASIRKGF